MNPVSLRIMVPGDRDFVIAMLADSDPWLTLRYSRADWERYFSALPEGREAFVAERNGRVVGLAVVRRNVLLGDYLELLGVAKEARGSGVGTLLLTHVESVVFTRAKNLFACVSDFNAAARTFYEKQGYREIGPIPDLIIPGSAEVLLRKTAGPARGSLSGRSESSHGTKGASTISGD
ncbi:MAG TPA: GNAT family N-acetyltransferase [Nitrospira sp.]|nr:GNAT family N-acetyltransferase [Nitrospira sp.]